MKKSPVVADVLAAIFISQFGESIYGTAFSNYLVEVHQFKASDRGILELPRELPGILSLFAVGVLFFMKETRIAAIAAALTGLGIAALGVPALSASFPKVVACIMVASLGQHIMMGVVDAIVVHNSLPENRGLRLGQMRVLSTAAGLAGALFVWIKWKFNSDFSVDFLCAGSLCLISCIFLMKAKSDEYPEHKSFRERFVFRRKYVKYYLLETLFGVRKQVFMTFGFWLMVSTLSRPPSYMGRTLLAAGVLGLGVQPLVGKIIQLFGERKVLIVDGALLAALCVAYAYSLDVFSHATAVFVVTACFMLDNLLFCVGAARTTYIARICECKEHITPSIYTGIAINHAVSIACAIGGGLLWTTLDSHRPVFLIAGVISVLSALLSWSIPEKDMT